MNTGAMSPQEQIELMRRASGEIKQLRAINAELAPKARAYDRMEQQLQQQLLDMVPSHWRSGGYSEDVVSMLDRCIDSVVTQLKDSGDDAQRERAAAADAGADRAAAAADQQPDGQAAAGRERPTRPEYREA